ncbi:hypothetical protein ACFOOM_10295 [Streptomyces echinoruber]|nr:hypothetical protein [Streptomyces echinoruber]
MLQDAIEGQISDDAADHGETSVTEPAPGSPLGALQDITAELPPLPHYARRGHRKVRERKHLNGVRTTSQVIAVAVVLIASAVSFFGSVVAYDPLRLVAASHAAESSVPWWPFLVFGPWLVASLSVVRAALHLRRAVHSWCVVLAFSLIAMLLCIAQASRDPIDMVAAALPSLASLACFQQLVRQITLTRPPRRAAPRHRVDRSASGAPSASAGEKAAEEPGGAKASAAGPPRSPDRAGTEKGERPGPGLADARRTLPGPRGEPSGRPGVFARWSGSAG